MRTSKGSSKASSTITVPRSLVLIRLIAHLRVRSDVDGAKREEKELVRRRHCDLCVGGGNPIDDVRSRRHGDRPADIQARQIGRHVRLHLRSRWQNLRGRVRRHGETSALAGRVGNVLVHAVGASKVDYAKNEGKKRHRRERGFRDRCAALGMLSFHKNTAQTVPNAAATPKGTRTSDSFVT